ncbi:MAG TPA: AAA family ATPase [Chloroflexota bacterium]
MHESVSHSEVRTFLIADVRGYTSFTLEHGDEAAAELAERFLAISREVIGQDDGSIFGQQGDQVQAVFPSARKAVHAAMHLQDRLSEERQRAPSLGFTVGVGLDAGEAVPVRDDYFGAAVNLAARLCSLAGPGEVLASDTVIGIARRLEGLDYVDRGQVQFKGFAEPVRVTQVVPERDQELAAEELPSPHAGPHAQQLPIGGFLGALPSGPLVGRGEEVSQMLRTIEAVLAGEGRLVLLVGEPGAGKTRLAQEATLELRDRGFLIAAGSSFEPRQSVPYYPFLDVLGTLYGTASYDLRSQTRHRWPYLGHLLPEAGIPVPAGSDNPEEQERLLRAVVSLVQAMAEENPVAILLDDLHWADEASLNLLQRLALQTRTNRVLLLGAYRDVDVQRQHPLERTLRDLYRAGLMERIPVGGLGQDETRALMAASFDEDVSEDFAGFVYHQTEGNPFFTQEVLHALVERGDVFRQNGHWERREFEEIDVPESVRSVIGERLSRLQERTQEFLREASVLGQTFQFDELQAIGDHAEEEVERALDEAIQIGIIREATDGQYSFNHVLTQSALYAELSGRRRRRLHLAAGEALEGLPPHRREGREAVLAWHFLVGDDRERARRHSLLAGDKAEAVFAHSEAARHYRTALDLARELGDDAHLREALRKLGAVLNLIGRYDSAVEALEEAIRLAQQADDLDGEIEAVMHLIRHAPERGKAADAVHWVESLLPRLEDYPVSPRKLAFFNAYAYFLVQSLRFDEGLQVARAAVAMAEALGDEYGLARARVSLGHLLVWHGRAAEAENLLEPAASYLEQAGDLSEAMRAASLLAQVYYFSGDAGAAERWRESSLRLAQQVGNAAQAVYEICMQGYLHMRLGDLHVAWEEGQRSLTEAREMDQSTMTGPPLGLLATLSWMQGKWDDLDRYACEMVSLNDHGDKPWWQRHGEFTLAMHDLLAGRADRVLARLEPIFAGVEVDIQEQALFLPTFAEAYLQDGNLPQAQHVLDTPLRLQELDMRGMLPDTLRVHAMVLRAEGDLAGAETVLNELLDLTRSLPFPSAEAQCLAEYGHLEATRGNLKAARERFEEALVIFRRLGAQPLVERTERAMAQLVPETAPEV